ncbi:MAG TPA: SseB family protein [Candidatus Limnocylindrales bacterium]|nr:SseB family protein [Candidatus Limnocylindrales bacterium]
MSSDDQRAGEMAPRLDALIDAEVVVPIRSSTGANPDPELLDAEAFRHGTDDEGVRFIAAFSSPAALVEFGPPGSDSIRMRARDLFERADAVQERVVVDPGAPTQIEVAVGVLAFLAAGIDPNRPDVQRARRPLGDLPTLEVPEQIPEPFGRELHAALEELPHVERAWLLRAGTAWTAGVQLHPDALLADFDAVRNRLHAVATEHLGSRRLLAVTDLRARALRDTYDGTAAPFYVRHDDRKGLLSRIFGG